MIDEIFSPSFGNKLRELVFSMPCLRTRFRAR